MSYSGIGSLRTITKRPPIQENINPKLHTQSNNTTQMSIALQQSYCLDKPLSPPKNPTFIPSSRSKSLATLGEITNLKYNTPVKDVPIKLPPPVQSQTQINQNELIGLATRMQELARGTIQFDKDAQLESMIEREKLKKALQQRELECDDLSRRNHSLTETLHQRDQQISELVHELRILEQRLNEAEVFMKQMNDDHLDEHQRLTTDLQEHKHAIEHHLKQLTQLNEEMYNKSKVEQQLHMDLGAAQDEIHHLRRQVEEANLQFDELSAKFKDLSVVRGELERVNKQMRFDLEEHMRRGEQMDNEIHLLHERHEETGQELSTWINKFQHLDRGHQVHIEEMRKQFEIDTQRRIDMENQKYHQKIQHEIAQFEQRIRMEQARVNEQEAALRDLAQERDQLIEENRCKEIDIEDMKNEMSTLSKIELDNRKMVAHIQYLENKLESIVQDGQRARQFTEDYRHKVSQKERSLAEQLAKLQAERDHLDVLLGKSNKDAQGLANENQQMLSELHQTQADLQKTRVQNEEFQTNMKLLTEDLRNLQVYRSRCHELQQNQEKRDDFRFVQLQEQYNQLKTEHASLQQAYNLMRSQETDVRSTKVLQQELNRREQSIRELESKVRFYAEENTRLIQR